ncbi:MAG: hypothetical protein GYB68_10090 [Chloroflexi bacterium]|nr:hypothetical protein [Chloroflexota bacterium]
MITQETSSIFSTLKLQAPAGVTLAIALALLIALSGLLEGSARLIETTDLIDHPGSVGSFHMHFDPKIAGLRDFAAEQGGVDCIMFGTSMVHRGLNPAVIGPAMQAAGGEALNCYNFGVGGVRPSQIAVFVDLLVAEYQPAVIILGTTAVEYGLADYSPPDGPLIVGAPFIQHGVGNWSLEGWLTHQSQAYRYYSAGEWWFLHRNSWQLSELQRAQLAPDGFGVYPGDPEETLTVPSLRSDRFREEVQYLIIPEEWAALQAILAVEERGVDVILVEMPFVPTYWTVPGQRATYLENFIRPLQSLADQHDAAFIAAPTLDRLPLRYWYDWRHLTVEGSTRYGEWLGWQLAQPPAASR